MNTALKCITGSEIEGENMNSKEAEIFAQEQKRGMSAGSEAMYNALSQKFAASSMMCFEYPLRRHPMFMAQVVLPLDLTAQESERLCAFIKTLAQPE